MTSTPEEINLVGQSRSFLDLMDQVSAVAPLERPVLVIGERGTGKELIAARLHFLSKRWGERLVTLNCAAIPETLIESELFGYEPGAFTGATKRRAGRFELADGGTLFLDEIASMSMAAQEKLLRVVEYGQFERVGSSAAIGVDVRVIAAANVDLPALADAGDFRHDLLDRLAFDVLTLPPLRARRSDIMVLAGTFAQAIAQELGWQIFPGFSAAAEEQLMEYQWPGNVRELRNVVERAVYRATRGDEEAGDVEIDDIVFDPFESPWRPTPAKSTAPPLPVEPAAGPVAGPVAGSDAAPAAPAAPAASAAPRADNPIDIRAALATLEKDLLEEALAANRFNQRDTASHLSLSYDQLRHALKKHQLIG